MSIDRPLIELFKLESALDASSIFRLRYAFFFKGVKNTFSDRNCSVALVYGILLGGELDWTVGL
jgi:hypothetical protein